MKRSILWCVVLCVIMVPAFVGAQAKVHSNASEFTYVQKAGTQVDLTAYYAQYKVDSKSVISAMGGIVTVKGLPKVLPTSSTTRPIVPSASPLDPVSGPPGPVPDNVHV